MANHPEAQAQLARLLGEESLRLADPRTVHEAVESGLERLNAGILAEAIASDDVTDRESALEFVQDRLNFLGALLDHGQRSRLFTALQGKIDAW